MKSANCAGKRVTVIGLGLFGGGAGAARYFAEHGAHVTVTDRRSEAVLKPSIEALHGLPIRFVLGRHDADDFRCADIVVANPGVPHDHPLVVMARGAGAEIEYEINLLCKLTPQNPKIGITGSNGKSTTTAMLGDMLRLARPGTLVGGNIGKCLLGELATLPEQVPIVLELSSFMLENMHELRQSPHIAMVTTLTPNHLDRHANMAEYIKAKQAILDYQRPGDVAILNADDPEVRCWPTQPGVRVMHFSLKEQPAGDGAFLDGDKLVLRIGGEDEVVALRQSLRLPGMHNVANALAAMTAAAAAGVRPWEIAEALSAFTGLPHRLEMVARTPDKVTFYNDSIATTPESAICALASFGAPITLIAGGSDKGVPFDQFGVAVANKARRLILLGVTAKPIEEAVRRAAAELRHGPLIVHVKNLEEAAREAASGAVPGEVVLLSPACASFDMFKNFEERGEMFRVLAQKFAVG